MDLDLPPPILVEDARGMERLLADLERHREIAVDTEADSFFNFREKVCLMQITAGERDYIVDPMARIDLAALGPVLADPHTTKVFHDGEYDVLILKRDHGLRFAGLFDTRVAAAALGEANPGLASVLKARYEVELDKSLQRSNWSARPLTPEQIRYARLDTHYLVRLMHEQRRELEAAGRTMIVEGECRRLERLEPVEPVFDPDDFVRIKGVRGLDPLGVRALRELFVLRHRLAEEMNLPPFKVLNNQTLVDLARQRPTSIARLGAVRGISPRQVRRIGDEVLRVLQRARDQGPMTRLPVPGGRSGAAVLSDEEFELHERLKEWRKDRARREGFDSSLVLNRHVLLRLAKEKPRERAELERVEGLLDWQIALFGEEVLDVIKSGLAAPPRGPGDRRRRGRGPR